MSPPLLSSAVSARDDGANALAKRFQLQGQLRPLLLETLGRYGDRHSNRPPEHIEQGYADGRNARTMLLKIVSQIRAADLIELRMQLAAMADRKIRMFREALVDQLISIFR